MSDYSAVAPPSNFTQTSAFAAALQRARQIAAKINPGGGEPGSLKRPLEDSSGMDWTEPEAKKLAGGDVGVVGSSAAAQAQAQAAAVAARVAAAAAAGLQGLGVGVPGLPLGGQVLNEDVRVPDKMVGLIIGRGGEQISRLQNESGCKIQMAPDSNGMPERACTLTGTREAITRARELIMNIVHQRSRTEGTGGLGDMNMGGAPSNMAHRGRMDGSGQDDMNMGGAPSNQAHVEIMVPGPKVGLIIGKGGETIKQLQEKSGAKMVIIQDGPTQEQEKPLRISGEPQKVEYAKQLVYDLIAEKEMQAQQYNQRGGGGGGGRGGGSNHSGFDEYSGDNGGGGGDGVEVLVPRAAVGVVIGKGGDMIKKIQNETGARVQFQQGRDDGPGERRCLLSGKPAQVDQARRRIEELIDSVLRRDNEMGRGGGRGGRGGGGGGFDRGMGGGRGGGGGEFGNGNPPGGGGWDNRRGPGGMQGGDKGEATFTIPAAKCGIVIGRGGETIKLINQQTGAHCELDRRPPGNPAEKVFIIRGSQDQIEQAKRIISDKIGMPPGPGGPPPTQYPLGQGGPGGPGGPQGQGPPQHFATPQGWGGGFQQPWQNQQQHPNDPSGGGQVQMNPATGQPDYSAQWAEYYRSLGMMREAEMIEQQSKGMTGAQTAPQPTPQQAAPQGATGAQNGNTPDYSLQWAEYYRSMGKIKEAEAIEAQMKTPKGGAGGQPNPAAGGGQPQQPGQPSYNQPGGYNYQPAPGGYYPNQPGGPGGPQPGQPPAPFNYPSGPGYAYAGQPQDNQ